MMPERKDGSYKIDDQTAGKGYNPYESIEVITERKKGTGKEQPKRKTKSGKKG